VTAVAAEVRAPIEGRRSTGAMKRLFEPSEVTLEDSILGVWEALEADTRAECPVCHGELETSGCMTCGSQLA
jgi:DnaJ-class molecular chaperone